MSPAFTVLGIELAVAEVELEEELLDAEELVLALALAEVELMFELALGVAVEHPENAASIATVRSTAATLRAWE